MVKIYLRFLAIFILLWPIMATGRETINLNRNWKFTKGDPANAETIGFDDGEWRTVQIPHDWAIEGPFDSLLPANTGKLPWKGVAWYRKKFEVSDEFSGKQFYLMFDGIMAL